MNQLNGVLGVCELNCWIKKSPGKTLHFGYGAFVYILKFILITGVIVFTILISKYLLQVSKYDKGLRNQVKQYRWKMLLFPLVQIVTGLFPSIYTFLLSFSDSNTLMGFFTLFFGTIQGILYPLCYLFNSDIINVFKKTFTSDSSTDDTEESELFDSENDF